MSWGVNEGMLTTWVARDRQQRDGAAGDQLSESEREELLGVGEQIRPIRR
ncbi:hypothetical protein IU459_36560 [Nocardia amamiensis]|uniref:Transposase n=1 Tax=Nocardia amamiensis TaxID=404578 RepID=A0ABS0D787_9NOCA|nr:hypothetical protein [Nocardia amamiensis]MBF6302983.1 hypothetical protein [Nocardia amamiensis]